ncbi:hypothetical protein K493DRAFT_237297 [Basidiobolus meristosporus CBS 931.73]|uniref:Transcription regulator Rua1 C-terminal domain-containing protein n=1 Tax=Basidiobolus meristosporus CBS 931.73 TaxID=1314790 RepID=A0A1Y1XPQ3_9FUNG|nr:hypothetical protein K493DRAFT_237297 [Basidiobolus meristosporus CBS 931.73]|eukprot:ORX87739.1 hypothetical protein K493DRAFT_237297 [Basidiobolus meristosporus CBS 931.73]
MPRADQKHNLTVPEDSKQDILSTDDEQPPKIKLSPDSAVDSNQSSPRLGGSSHSPLPRDLGNQSTPLRSDAGEPSDNDIPAILLEADKPKPHRQPPRFEGDIYTPLWVRGVGKAKEGLCPLCKDRCLWLKIKTSAYWYHLNYQHGISSNTGRPFASPVETRIHAVTGLKEALCHKCGQWVAYESPRNSKSGNLEDAYWWRHAQKCHQ